MHTLLLFLEVDVLWVGNETGSRGNHDDVEGVPIAKIEGFWSRSLFFSTDTPTLASCVEDGSRLPNMICTKSFSLYTMKIHVDFY